MNGFSERLKGLRGERTLREVADLIGITRVAMGYYEKGERKPDIEMIYKIARFYGVSSDYLIGIDTDLSDYERLKKENKELKKKIAQIIHIAESE